MTEYSATEQRDAEWGIRLGRERREAIAQNLEIVADMEARAVRITVGPAGRCFQLPGDFGQPHLMVINNEQPRDSEMHYLMAVLPVTREDAEDFYGWAPEP